MPAAIIDRVLTQALRTYVDRPWTWPREADLVVDLVSDLRAALPPVQLSTSLNLARNLVDVGSTTARTAPRVRTEVKVEKALRPAGDTSEVVDAEQGPAAKKKQKHEDRIDIGVFQTDRTVVTTVHPNGARDVVLEVAASDMAALIEVKLYPDSYVDHGAVRWFMDVAKLAGIAHGTRAVLLVDTALPLSTIGIVVKKARGAALGRVAGSLPPWPLPDETFTVQSFRFTPVDAPREGGLYLWALALRRTSGWSPAFNKSKGRMMEVLDIADVRPRCWEVTRSTSN